MERILAIDYGRRRIGLAACDPLGITAQPIGAHEGTPEEALAAILRLCAERQVERIVVGLPLNMDGSEGEMAREVRGFAAKLAQATRLPVDFSDERLTSWEAEGRLREMGRRRKRKGDKGRVDAMAAAQILRDYLDARRP
ncbi:MAG: Holliday junction resolvase RuvX [Planctomycetes bacterium]|nr:Holliday junction resolvase RuvX [Planctomycetota bacterium]